jgi:hypothetical protein
MLLMNIVHSFAVPQVLNAANILLLNIVHCFAVPQVLDAGAACGSFTM